MSRSWAGWLAFLVLAATVSVVSCQAWRGPAAAQGPVAAAPERAG